MKLQEQYKKEILPKLQEKFDIKNVNEVPKLEKVVINVGFGKHLKEKAYIENVVDVLTKISGQKPIQTKAKKSISSFKIREGMVIGACVTLRGERMNDFVEKLIKVSFPRVRDFRGISSKGIDKCGNMTIGIKEHTCFPEIKVDEVDNVFSLEISFTTSTRRKEESLEMFRLMGFPFKKD
jgi:large subunit ribosomal protein L5